jgi:parallel beta-helix repeat protein
MRGILFTKYFTVLLIFGFVLGSFLPTPPVSAQKEESTGWEATGQAGGPTQGISLQGNYAYIGVGPRLVVVDISDPANPHQVGATAMLDDFVLGVTVSGTLAYLAAGTAGLLIVDISSPLNPFVVGSWNSPGYAEGVTVSDSTAFLADGPYGLRVVDVSNPAAPVEIAHAFDMNYAYAVAVSEGYAYVAAGGAGLLLVDISSPAYPVEAGAYDTPGNARGLAVQNDRAYIADERYGLQIINVSDPLHPALLGAVQTYGWFFDVAVSGSLAYVSAAFGGLRVVNISDPAHPLEVGNLTWAQSNTTGLVLAGDHVYLADRKNGLRVVNSSNPTNPVQIGYWSGFSFAISIEVEGDYAYVAAGFNGVRIYNISNPAHPVEVGSFMVDGFILNIKLAGSTLYAGTFLGSPEAGLYALDISDPTHPQMVGYYANIEECWGIDVDGSMVYVADVSGLKIFDFSNPPNLNLVGFHPYSGTGGISVRDGLAYVSKGGAGVEIYNITDPATISLVGSFTSPTSSALGPVSLDGNNAYVSEHWGLRILDISNPASPTEVSYTPTHEETYWLAFNGSLVFVAEGSYGFSVYDVSNPAAPQLINQTAVVGSVQAVALSAGRLFTASGEGGLQIFTETAVSGLPQPVLQSQGVWEEQPMLINAPGRLVHSPNLASDIPAMPSAPDRPAATCTVTSAADSGAGTLRACLENQVSGDVITFSASVFPTSAPVTIHVGPDRLPWLTQGSVTIDASNTGVILDGSLVLGAWDPGIGMNSDNNTVRGLQILNFPAGIVVLGNNNRIGGSRLVGSGPSRQGYVVSGNRGDGIAIGGYGNIILGNLIGLDVTGTSAFPNHWSGVTFNGPDNTLGSLNPGEDNVISANDDAGITMYGYNVSGNQIIGNKIGTDITGNVNLGNKIIGVYVECGANNTLVHGNLISSNGVAEIYVWDFNTDFNVLTGNRISTNLAGTAPLPNLPSTGIAIGNAAYTRIGGTVPGEGNTVGNPGGVSVEGPFRADTLVLGNHIGLNAAGTAVLAGAAGLRLGGATRTIVGGATPAEANYITTDQHFSVDVRSTNNVIAGNFLGLAIDGVTPLATAGFQILSMRDGNVIQGNHIANATSAGIWLEGGQTNTIRRNSIYANPFKGIFLNIDANNNLPAPNFSLNATGGIGTTCPSCTVELFLDEGNQGRFYLEDVVANDTGAFEFPALCPLQYPYLTATATDLQGNTSEFSDPQAVSWDCITARPAPSLVSLDPTSQPALAPTFLLTISGANFYAGSVVRWNGLSLPTTVLSSTQAQAVIPSYLFQEGGEFSVTVFTPAPGGGESGVMMVNVAPPVMVNLPMILRK